MIESPDTQIELPFPLEIDDDGWPPVAVEWLWCRREAALYRVLSCPLFVKGISVGDIIAVELDDKGQVERFEVDEPSDHSTIWLLINDQDLREGVLSRLRALGCNIVGGTQAFSFACAVDVPATLDIAVVDDVLGPLERSEQIAVAHPSFRHEEPPDAKESWDEPNG